MEFEKCRGRGGFKKWPDRKPGVAGGAGAPHVSHRKKPEDGGDEETRSDRGIDRQAQRSRRLHGTSCFLEIEKAGQSWGWDLEMEVTKR